MAGTIKFKRGTEAARTGSPAVVPAEGEPIWTTDQKKLYVGDGITAGGIAVGSGTVTSVGIIDGDLIDSSGGPITSSGNITINVDLSELATSVTDGDGDYFCVVDATNAQYKLTKANIALSGFNNDSGWNNYSHPNHTGDVTSVGDGAQTIAANAVTNTKLRDSTALSVIGRSTNTTGDPADISAGTDGHILRRSGTTLGFGTIATAGIANDAVSNAKLGNVAQDTIKGRVTAGTGDPEDLTATQVRTLINVADGANNYVHPNHSGHVTSTGDGATVLTVSAITGQTELASGLASTDELLVSDAGVISRMDVSVLEAYMQSNLSFGTVTSVTGGTGIASTGGTTPSLSLTVDELSEKTGNVVGTDRLVGTSGTTNFAETISGIPLSIFNNDSGWTSNTGTVTSVGITDGNLIDSSGGPITGSGNITINVDLSELATSVTDGDGDYFCVVDTLNAQRKLTKGNINISGFNNDAGYTSNAGTVTSVSGTGTVSGLTLSGTVTSSGNLTLGGAITGFATDSHNHTLDGLSNTTITSNTAGEILKWSGSAWINNTLAEAGIYSTSNPAGYTTNTGTVTSVGGTGTVSGLTLSGTVTSSGNLTLGGTLAIGNGAENLTSAEVGYLDGATSTQTASKLLVADSSNYLTFKDTKETVYSTSGSQTIDPTNGQIHVFNGVSSSITLTLNTTNFLSGQSVVILMSGTTGGSVTWSGVGIWLNNGGTAPALSTTGYTSVEIMNATGTIAGFVLGEY